jgi:hypothetical protein
LAGCNNIRISEKSQAPLSEAGSFNAGLVSEKSIADLMSGSNRRPDLILVKWQRELDTARASLTKLIQDLPAVSQVEVVQDHVDAVLARLDSRLAAVLAYLTDGAPSAGLRQIMTLQQRIILLMIQDDASIFMSKFCQVEESSQSGACLAGSSALVGPSHFPADFHGNGSVWLR